MIVMSREPETFVYLCYLVMKFATNMVNDVI
jgi:hypothetical protein